MRSTSTALTLTVLIAAFASMVMAQTVMAQTLSISTVGDNTGTLTLYKQTGGDFKPFALAEIKGRIEFGGSGIVDGEESFQRLKIIGQDKWLKIKKANLVKGKLVITTEDGKIFTIYDLQGDYVGKIKPGGTGS